MEHFGVEPDLITRREVDRRRACRSRACSAAPRSWTRPVPGGVGGTYVGNPVAQAAALAVLDVIDDEGLVERSAAIGETIRARMLALAGALARDRRRARPRRDARDRARLRPGDEGARARARRRGRRRRRSSAACCSSPAASTATASACSFRSSSPTRSSRRRSASGKRRSRRLSISEAPSRGRRGRCSSVTSSQIDTSSRSSPGPAACRPSSARTTACSSAPSR